MEGKCGLPAYTAAAEDVDLGFTTALTKEHALFANYKFMAILLALFSVI
jgi:hypothetical protein